MTELEKTFISLLMAYIGTLISEVMVKGEEFVTRLAEATGYTVKELSHDGKMVGVIVGGYVFDLHNGKCSYAGRESCIVVNQVLGKTQKPSLEGMSQVEIDAIRVIEKIFETDSMLESITRLGETAQDWLAGDLGIDDVRVVYDDAGDHVVAVVVAGHIFQINGDCKYVGMEEGNKNTSLSDSEIFIGLLKCYWYELSEDYDREMPGFPFHCYGFFDDLGLKLTPYKCFDKSYRTYETIHGQIISRIKGGDDDFEYICPENMTLEKFKKHFSRKIEHPETSNYKEVVLVGRHGHTKVIGYQLDWLATTMVFDEDGNFIGEGEVERAVRSLFEKYIFLDWE